MISVKTFVLPTECPDCKTVSAIMAEIQQLPIVVHFETIDILNNPDIVIQYNVQSVPTVIVCKDGVAKYTLLGVMEKQEYINSIGLA